MYNKILINAYLVNNLGDDLFIIIMCERYKNTIFYIIESKPYTNVFNSIQNIKICSPEEVSSIKFDLQIMIGGSLFMQPKDIYNINSKFESVTNIRLSPKIPFIIIGANFGPYTEETHLKLYKKWFSTLDDICFRDMQSYNLFSELPNVRWAPDVIFNYNLHNYKHSKAVSISCIYNNQRIGLTNYSQKDYFKQLANISVYYIEHGYTIKFAAFCTHQGDSIAIQNILSYIPSPYIKNVEICEYDGINLDLFLSFFLDSEYIIGTRFHSIILGWLAGIPTFPIVYNIKTYNVIKSYDFKGNYVDIDNIQKCALDFIDYNRKNKYCLNCIELVNKASKQFEFLDRY